MSAINLNHKEGIIYTEDDKILQITENGAVRIGDGSYLSELNNPDSDEAEESYKGVIRFNKNTGTLQYCDGFTWKDFSVGIDNTSGIIWALTF